VIQDLLKVEDRVKDILEKYPACRDSDKKLWLAYNCLYNNLQGIQWNYASFRDWILSETTPVFESLSRARRKVQENFPHLVGTNKVIRNMEQESVKQWSIL